MKNMKLSFEVPLRQAEELDSEQDYLFVLAQCLEDPAYKAYVRHSDKMKILDNGANEGDAVGASKLIALAEEIGADTVIIPDKQFDTSTTLWMFDLFVNAIPLQKRRAFRYMAVPQGKTMDDMLFCYNYMMHRQHTPVDTIGMQFKFLRQNGMKYADYIVEAHKKTETNLHFLGFAGAVQFSNKYKAVKTMDTSVPLNFAFAKQPMSYEAPFPKGIDVWKDVVDVELALKYMHEFKQKANGDNHE
jgi:hypothetical protein